MARTTANDVEVATKPPGPDELPLVGSLKDFFADPLQFYTETADEYGPVAYFTLGGNDFVTVSSPEYVKDVLVNRDDEYVKGQQFDDLMGPICGNGVLLAEGDFWQSQRETLEPAFDPETLSRHCRVMTDYTQRRMDRWTPGEERSVYEDLMYTTLEIAGKVLFDFDVRPLDGDVPGAMETVRDYVARRLWRPVEVPEWMPMPGKREYREALALIDETAYTIIDEAKASDSDRQTVIDLLLDKDDPLSREQIRDEVFTLLLAAHENTTLSATYTLQLLAKNPYAMEKVHEGRHDARGLHHPRRHDRLLPAVGHPPRLDVLRRPAELPPRTLDRRVRGDPSGVRLLPVRRRPAPLYRLAVRQVRGESDSRHDAPKLELGDDAGENRVQALHLAPARHGYHDGADAEIGGLLGVSKAELTSANGDDGPTV